MISLEPIADQIKKLKDQQQSCTKLLLDCLSVRESHPEHAERLEDVIATIESVMAHNSDMLNRLEAELLYNN